MKTRISALTVLIVSAIAATGALPATATPSPGSPSGIIGGSNATIESVPWQVGLITPTNAGTEYDSQFCGGSIINKRWVITAAHCLADYNHSSLGIFAGSEDLDVPYGTYEYTSTKWIIHPSYTGTVHDIALVKIDDEFALSDPTMEPIALPTELNPTTFPSVGQQLTISGWGDTDATAGTNYPTLLKSAVVGVISASASTACGIYGQPGEETWNANYELCVGNVAGGVDTCSGDSGGPYAALNVDGDGDLEIEPTLVGITSWGDGCAEAVHPGIATRVSSYVDWVIPMKPTMTVSYSKSKKTHTVKWVAATNQKVSSPVTGYRVEYSSNYGMTWKLATTTSSSARSYSRKIARDTLWRVAAVNEVNNNLGPYLWAETADYPSNRIIAAPSSPTGFQRMTGPGAVRFRWAAPSEINGTAVWTYRVYRQNGTAAAVVALETSANSNVTVPTGTLPATFWVTAVNNAGESAPTTSIRIGR